MINGVIFFTSAAILGYEVTFTRVFAYAQWYNLSAVIITMALLGSGISGTVITLARNFIERRYSASLFAASVLFPVFMASGFILSAILPINPYEMRFSIKQVFFITIYFAAMCLPFFAGSAVICVTFLKRSPARAYAINLFGAGAGAALPVILSYHIHPYSTMTVMIILSFIPVVLLAANSGGYRSLIPASAVFIIILFAAIISFMPEFRKVSEYKPVSCALNLPGARIIDESYSPLSVIQVVEAGGLRATSGLSLTSPWQVPVQRMMFFDGDSPSPITPFSGDLKSVSYMKYLSSYLPYYLKGGLPEGRALVIGAGGGESILKALMAGFSFIDAVEVNSQVISLMTDKNAAYSGNIYGNKSVTIHNEDGRSYARRSSSEFDLIDIPMVDAYNAAASGVYALNESYLYTVESFSDFYRRLSPRGVLSVTRWLTIPPRDSLKIFNTAATSLIKMNILDPEKRLIAVRSLQTVTLLISREPFSGRDIDSVKQFCSGRLFDMVYYPGMKEDEAGIRIKQEEYPLYEYFVSLLSADSGKFISSYNSDITAPEDNRPYFYNFFKPSFLSFIIRYGPAQIPVTEWGYLLLLIILIPVAAISFAAILYPVLKIRKTENIRSGIIIPYFSIIAAGYFFIEMPFIQKMILFLGSPVFSLSIIISSLLVFSGAGSLFSDSLLRGKRGILFSVIIISSIISVYAVALDPFFKEFISSPLPVKVLIVITLTAPPAFFMGFPFPRGLSLVQKSGSAAVPLAWGVNGFVSVISIIAAAICAVICGYRVVLITAVVCYITAGLLSAGLAPDDD